MSLDVDHFRGRVLQDALIEATSGYWLRRAEQFDAVGNARCAEVARACRARAYVSLLQTEIEPKVLTALDEADAS